MGVASMVIGIVALIIGFIPFCGTWALLPAVVAVRPRRLALERRLIDQVRAAMATESINQVKKDLFKKNLLALARRFTEAADMEFDDHGRRIDRRRRSEELTHTVVVPREQESADDGSTPLLDLAEAKPARSRKKSPKTRKR